jgi:hypothetical protein
MNAGKRSRLGLGVLLVAIGLAFLALQIVPGLANWFTVTLSWPLIVVGVGVLVLIVGLLSGAPEAAIGACVVAGIGGILYYQNLTGNWVSWAYAWTLIPGFSGVGMVISGILGGRVSHSISNGLNQIIASVILFLIFGSIFGPVFGGFNFLGPYWPLLLVAAGLLVIVRAVFRRS